ncbi:MAG: segregation/condensation protein A [Clostridia bacterium]|nr:segregation/condensation protein A [Clostridia bacterium]
MEQIIYKMELFEGPLDLLLSLISKNKMSIEDIKISVICDQYMDYIKTMQSLDIELSSEFIVMASQLMLIKSRTLLPRQNDEEEEDPAEELARALQEYKRAKEASSKLGGLYSQYSGRFEKDTDEIMPDRSYVAEHSVNLLSSALLSIMSNFESTDEAASEKIKPLISTKTVSVGEKVYAVLRILVVNGGHVNVIDCFEGIHTKHEAVATFMALLEMLRAGRITLEEDLLSDENGVINLENNVYINLFSGKIRQASEENNG